jgi:hypothetical protein
MRFGTWNVRSLFRAGSLTAAARELARYKLVDVQEVRWDKLRERLEVCKQTAQESDGETLASGRQMSCRLGNSIRLIFKTGLQLWTIGCRGEYLDLRERR